MVSAGSHLKVLHNAAELGSNDAFIHQTHALHGSGRDIHPLLGQPLRDLGGQNTSIDKLNMT